MGKDIAKFEALSEIHGQRTLFEKKKIVGHLWSLSNRDDGGDGEDVPHPDLHF